MANSEKILECLDKNDLTIDCKEMRLSPISAISEKDQHVGPGSITQNSDGHFLVKMYCQGNITPARVLALYQNAEPGKLLEDEHYYVLEADDLEGNRWTTDPVLPQFLSGMDSTVILSKLIKYLRKVLEYEDVSWHPLFRWIHSVFKSGEASIEAEGLTLSVSIEGLLNQIFREKEPTNEDFEQKRSEALRVICNSAMDKDVKKRLKGFIRAMKAIQAKDRLYALRDSGVIENKLVNSWNELRNPSAHGELVEEKDLQIYLDRCASALVLFYQLIFLAIGYMGNFTDYSSYGYPMKTFNKRNS